MVTELGKNLSVIIVTEPGRDWEAFATWYSIFKNLPESEVSIVSFRNGETPFQLFQWAKRLKISVTHATPSFSDNKTARLLEGARVSKTRNENILVIPHLTMSLSTLNSKILDCFNNEKYVLGNNSVFLKNSNVDQILNDLLLEEKTIEMNEICFEAKETESLSSIVSYQKGCGKWIHKLKGCPFSNAAGLVSYNMTVNEVRIIDLWKRMCQLYSVVL